MYAAEQLFDVLTYEDLYYTLKGVLEEDVYLSEYLEDDLLQDFLYMLDVYGLIYISSDDRVLLTPKGEKVLQYVFSTVEFEKKSSKVKNRKKL